MYIIPVYLFAQNAGEVMFVGYNADGDDGFSFVALVDIPANTTLFFTDNEWDGVSTFGTGEGFNSWSHTSIVPAGTVIAIENLDNNPAITSTLGTASVDGGTAMAIAATNEAVYMYLGTNRTTPTTFLSAISNESFDDGSTVGSIAATGLTIGLNAVEFTGDEDVMVYINNVNCNTTISNCAASISDISNWADDSNGPNDHTDFAYPDFPTNVCDIAGTLFYPKTTYYSLSTGDWDANTSWSLTPDGSSGAVSVGIWPRRTDNVVIQDTHTITVNAVDDNKSCGNSPDGLARSNVGPFSSSNLIMFYHTGDILIDGTLSITGIEAMVEGYVQISSGGSFTLTSSFVNLSFLEANSGSSFSSADDLILASNSTTIINTTSISNDDLIISFTDATLCGTGTTTLQNGLGSIITYANGGTVSQICTEFTVECTGAGCSGFPTMGTGSFISGNTGPGGIGNSNNNQLWVRADDLDLANNDEVNMWSDVSGNNLSAENTSGATQFQRPSFATNSANGLASVSFDGGDILSLTTTPLNLAPTMDTWSFFSVFNVGAGNTGTIIGKRGASTGQFQYFVNTNIMGASAGTINNGTETATGAWKVASSTTSTSTINSWINGVADISGGTVSTLTSTSDVTIGARRTSGTTGLGFPLTGNIAEIAMYNVEINQAQRIIIDNYLAAKYDVDVSASGNDFYTMDDNGNGDFDFEVAGIGQGSDGSNHRDARGTGIVRMWNPDALDNNEFLMWGHDNTSVTSTAIAIGTDVDGTIIEERLSRIWRVDETGDLGSVSISFDFFSLGGSPLGSDLRLLIDRNGDGFADNDITPIAGSVLNNIVNFSGVNFQNGDRFTLGNANGSTPLPIELSSFDAKAHLNSVLITWITVSEVNNDFFTIERSQNGLDWDAIKTTDGAGTSFEINSYEEIDKNPFQGTSYYRLKQTDLDGQYSYSKISLVNVFGKNKIHIFPNPTNGTFKIISRNIDIKKIKLLNGIGQHIDVSISSEAEEIVIDASNVPNGFYILQINDDSLNQSIRFIKK